MDTSTNDEPHALSQSRIFSVITLGIASVIGAQLKNMTTPGEQADAVLERARLTRIALELSMDMQELSHFQDTSKIIEEALEAILASLEEGASDNALNSSSGDHGQMASLSGGSPADNEKLPKLSALATMLRSQEGPVADFHEEDLTIGRKLEPYIHLDHFIDKSKDMEVNWDRYGSKVASALSPTTDQADFEAENQNACILTEEEEDKLGQAEKFSKAMENLFIRLNTCLECCCSSGHVSRIHLLDFTQVQLDFNIPTAVFPDIWCSSTVTDHRYWDTGNSIESMQSLNGIDSLCSMITTSAGLKKKLHLTFESQRLWRRKTQEESFTVTALARKQLSLEQLLTLPHFKFSKADKLRFLVILARALLLLFGTPWWTEHNIAETIFFEHDPNSLAYSNNQSPCVYRPFKSHPGTVISDETVPQNVYPVFLDFALLLLQFEMGRKHEPTKDDCNMVTGKLSSYVMLGNLLDAAREEVSIECRLIGEACLRFDDHLKRFSVRHPNIEESLRIKAVIHKRLFKPLLKVFRRSFPDKDVGLDLPDWSDASNQPVEAAHVVNNTSPLPQAEYPQEVQPDRSVLQREKTPSDLHSANSAEHQTHRELNLRLFDVDTAYHAGRSAYASQFFDLHKRFLATHIRRHDAQARVKVAVLDTGLDENNSEIKGLLRHQRSIRHRSAIAETKPFDGGGTVEDSDGHGTHTATLLMKIAPQADLYIAKIASDTEKGIESLHNVVQAIEWAIKKQVDIISMSFGFPARSFDLAELSNHIEAAHKADILLFAAASNAGGNGRRAYPASEPHVMCIHAVDGQGNNCGGFNPSAIQNEDNFATLGIGIECTWDEERCYRSGTSYATPIAAGFAANALEYALYHKERGNLHPTTYSRLRKPSGMRRMFRLMADEREKGSGYQWVRPWWFWPEDGKDHWICENLEQALGL